MIFTPKWQRHIANIDAEMHRLYTRGGFSGTGLTRMRIAKIYDCRSSEVKAAVIRHQNLMTLKASARGGAHKPKPVSLSRVSILESDQ